jgi:hypothetical protein
MMDVFGEALFLAREPLELPIRGLVPHFCGFASQLAMPIANVVDSAAGLGVSVRVRRTTRP